MLPKLKMELICVVIQLVLAGQKVIDGDADPDTNSQNERHSQESSSQSDIQLHLPSEREHDGMEHIDKHDNQTGDH